MIKIRNLEYLRKDDRCGHQSFNHKSESRYYHRIKGGLKSLRMASFEIDYKEHIITPFITVHLLSIVIFYRKGMVSMSKDGEMSSTNFTTFARIG